jgi:hypothetical protein
MTCPASIARAPARVPALGILLAAGLALRLGLAYVVFPGAGFSTDLGLFQSWATTLASTGPGSFYATAGTANYPPGYLWVLWALASVGNAIGGLIGTNGATIMGGEFSVLTANAYNAWALVGSTPLASVIGAGGGSWTADSTVVLGGLSAVTIGAGLLASIGLLVSGGLLVRDGRLPILLGLAVLAFAFYAVPTRVHERYLVPFFAVGAILAAGSLARAATFVATAFLNVINLHAVLAAPLQVGRGFGSGGFGGGPGGATGGGAGLARGSGPGGGPPTGGGSFTSSFTSIQLPFADLARSQVVVEMVAVGQTLVMVGLLAAWVVVLVRPPERAMARPRLPVSTAPSHG